MVDHFLAVVGMITDPDKNKKRKARVVSEDLVSGVYRKREHRLSINNFRINKINTAFVAIPHFRGRS